MNLTNPPIVRGLGKTGLLNRKGQVLGEPTTRGLAQTATRATREGPLPDRDLKITQMVVAFSATAATTVSADWTVVQEAVIHRRAGSLLDINFGFQTETLDETYGGGPFFRVQADIRRDGTSLVAGGLSSYIPAVFIGASSADELYSGRYLLGYVDTDYVSGEATYELAVRFLSGVGVNPFDAGVEDRYVRLLERRQ